MNRICIVSVLSLLALTGAAQADEPTTRVFPLSGRRLAAPLSDAPAVLTRALAKSLDADVASAPIEDAAGLLECDLTEASCLQAVARSVGAQRIVFGTIEARPSGATVRLTWFELSTGRRERRFVVESETTKALTDQVIATIEHREVHEPGDAPVPPITTPYVDATLAHGPTRTTWAMLGGGLAAMGLGAGVLLSTQGLRDQVRRAPRDSIDDIHRLVVLERRGQTRSRIGGVLVLAGAAATTIGVVRYVVQRKHAQRENMIDVVPESGGASVVFTTGFR